MIILAKPLLRVSRATSESLAQQSDRAAILKILVMLAFAGFCGLVIPFQGVLVPAIVGALALSILVLALSPVAIVWLMLVLVLLVVGQFTFFIGIRQAFWVPYLLLLLITIKLLLEKLRFISRFVATPSFSTTSILIVLFCLFFCLSAVINKTDFASIGVAAKNYVFPWFLTMLVASTIQYTEDLQRIWRFMLWVAVLQLPFAVPEHFYYAKRVGASWDAVVGSFGGNFMTGGASGAMAIFLVFGIVLATSLFRRNQISWKMLALVVLTALATIALAEVKVFFICLPLGFIFLFRKRIFTSPLESLGVGMLVVALLSVILFAYQQTYSDKVGKEMSLEDTINFALYVESDPYFFNPETREVSRIGAILMWNRYNNTNDDRFYIGHGPAASRESETIGIGVAARKYPFMLTTSTASSMLWDVGLCGYIILLGTLLAASITAFRLTRYTPPVEAAALDSIGVMLLLNIPLTLYNRDLIESTVTQVLVAFWIGYVLLSRKKFSVKSTQIIVS
ncbi:MAG: hypothetical protein ACXV8U_16070 [Methylobacter sp.]